jgi:hypothetical protein
MFSINVIPNKDGSVFFTIVRPDTCYHSGKRQSLDRLWELCEEEFEAYARQQEQEKKTLNTIALLQDLPQI